jgi:hypothetical protein
MAKARKSKGPKKNRANLRKRAKMLQDNQIALEKFSSI